MRRSVLVLMLACARVAAAEVDPLVPTPRSVLGYDIGEYHTSYLGVVRYAEALAAAVPERVRLVPIGVSYERRPMMLLVISSPRNMARLDAIRKDIARLTDTRTVSDSEADEIIRRSPAVVWDNFGNDGNESAAVEAALEMAYRLAASRDDEVARALDSVVAVLNVCHNPESRERFVTWYNASQVGPRGNPDPQAMEHSGPWGMDTNYNRYQIDLNRDSVWATQKETRNVIAAYREWNPQTFIDHHGETENFFFPPVALPVNPNIPSFHLEWLETYGRAIARAADARGWSYFTGETFDVFYPGYWDAYPFLKGAIGFTFETNAGGSAGLSLERDDETIVTLRDGIDRHVEGGLAVLLVTAAQRERKLRDYYRFRKTAIEEGRTGPVRAYAILPGADPARAAELVSTLMLHGIEVRLLPSETAVARSRDYLGGEARSRKLPAGTYVVRMDQPEKRMIQAIIEKSTDQQPAFLEEEKAKREHNRRRGRNVPEERAAFYDVTAWALPFTYGVEAYAIEDAVGVGEALAEPPVIRPPAPDRARSAYLFDPRPLGSARLAFALLREGFKVAVARKSFAIAGRDWPVGTFVVRTERNPAALHERIATLAAGAAMEVVAVDTAWTERGIDLGSASVDSLKAPRIAVVADDPTDESAYGAIWFLLEQRLGQPFTALRAREVSEADLSRYDVIVLPDGDADDYKGALGDDGIERLTRWVEDGGVLVCTGGASALAVDRKVNWSRATLLGPPPKEGEEEEQEPDGDAGATAAEPAATTAAPAVGGAPAPDRARARGRAKRVEQGAPARTADESTPPGALETETVLERERRRRSQETEQIPGAIFAGELDPRHFLGWGYGTAPVPVLITSSNVFRASPSGANVVRIRRDTPRLSGFTWPEAEARLRGAAYLVDEPRKRGHVILFADDPNFRNVWRGLEKLFTNALLLAPSL